MALDTRSIGSCAVEGAMKAAFFAYRGRERGENGVDATAFTEAEVRFSLSLSFIPFPFRGESSTELKAERNENYSCHLV